MEDLSIEILVMPGADGAWERARRSFSLPGLEPPSRFEAIDGSRLPQEVVRRSLTPRAAYELSVGRRFPWGWVHESVPSLGAVGCYLSHLELWKRAADRGRPTLILEQDAELEAGPEELLLGLARVRPEADVTLLGHFRSLRPFPFSGFSRQPPAGVHALLPKSDVFGTHAYVVTPTGAGKLVERALPINAQVDAYVRFLSAPDAGVAVDFHEPSLIRQQPAILSLVQPPKTAVDDVLLGSMIATRAALGILSRLVRRPWYHLQARFRAGRSEAVRSKSTTEEI